MAEYTRNSGTGAGTPGSTGGTGYTGGTYGPGRPGPREPRNSAALWIVGIVVVVGALAIWIARDTVDDADRMQARPGMERTTTDRDFDRTGVTSPYGNGTENSNYENRGYDQDRSTDARFGTGAEGTTMEGQEGANTINGSTSTERTYDTEPRMNSGDANSPGTGTNSNMDGVDPNSTQTGTNNANTIEQGAGTTNP